MKKKLEHVESYCIAVGISGDKNLSYNGVCIQYSVIFMRSIKKVGVESHASTREEA